MPNTPITKRSFIRAAAGAAVGAVASAQTRPPNVVLFVMDDLGYGDLPPYGSRLPTTHINRMAREGVVFTQYCAASPVCSPSRAALLTGRYPPRTGVQCIMFPGDSRGLLTTETTLAGMLKTRDYRTMCIGKWHLGSLPQFMPTSHGFDEFYGLPYSHDMSPLPLMHNLDVVEQPAKVDMLTQRYTDQAVQFIANSKSSPFFLYFAYHIPHVPLVPSARFRGVSRLGLYGDVVLEMDWSVGRVLKALRDTGTDNNTLLLFTSDHGPWFQGSAGRLRGRKGETLEGGVRVPFIARFPGRIPPASVARGFCSALDILPTLAGLSGAPLPPLPLDGVDIWPMLTGEQVNVERDIYLYFDDWNVQCARQGRWKLHVARYNSFPWVEGPPGGRFNLPLACPELYDLENDPGESYDLAPENPGTVAAIRARIEELLPSFPGEVPSSWYTTNQTQVTFSYPGQLPARKI